MLWLAALFSIGIIHSVRCSAASHRESTGPLVPYTSAESHARSCASQLWQSRVSPLWQSAQSHDSRSPIPRCRVCCPHSHRGETESETASSNVFGARSPQEERHLRRCKIPGSDAE